MENNFRIFKGRATIATHYVTYGNSLEIREVKSVFKSLYGKGNNFSGYHRNAEGIPSGRVKAREIVVLYQEVHKKAVTTSNFLLQKNFLGNFTTFLKIFVKLKKLWDLWEKLSYSIWLS